MCPIGRFFPFCRKIIKKWVLPLNQLGRFIDRKMRRMTAEQHTAFRRMKKPFVAETVRTFPTFLTSGTFGVTAEKRTPKLIVSLTSYPARIEQLHWVLSTLLKQTVKPDAVILWLGEEQFPNKLTDLPDEITALQNLGLTIRWTKDIRSYTKLIPALKEYPEDIIVTADDDVLYQPQWLEKLWTGYRENPTAVICHRVHVIQTDTSGRLLPYRDWLSGRDLKKRIPPSFKNFLTGVGGVLYPPHCLHSDVSDESVFRRICPSADDIWFWAMAVRQGTKIVVCNENIGTLIPLPELGGTLLDENAVQNDIQLRNILECYPELKEKINTIDSGEYWENRYKNGRNSGAGSYRQLAEFKANFLNDFVAKNRVTSVIEFGSGDGNQLRLAKYPRYIGVDVSRTAVVRCRGIFTDDADKQFIHLPDYAEQTAELSLSLDVIYHLVENNIFEEYMHRLFNAAERYVIVYADNEELPYTPGFHVRHRRFTNWIEKNKPEWKLLKHVPNKYPFDERKPSDTSFSDFYVFVRR